MSRNAPLPAAAPRPLARFARDENGGILVFWGLFLAVGFGFVALTFDIGRVANTQSELQSFADQVALAAAGELDGRSDAIDRATAAANGLIRRRQTFGDGDPDMGAGDFTLLFLTSLPAIDTTPVTGGIDPANASEAQQQAARFVQVTVNRRTVQTPFAAVNATLIGRAGANVQAQVGATAVAGVSGWACDITPLFFCVPSPDWRVGDPADPANKIGDQILLRTGGNQPNNTQNERDRDQAFWQPGNFGFLNPNSLPVDPDGPCKNRSGANLYRCLVGAERAVTQCLQTDGGIDTLTGQRQGLVRAFNTRFDMYDGPMNSETGNSAFRPAPNVLSDRWEPSSGQASQDPPNLPRDKCIEAETCRFGNNDWDRDLYIDMFHGGDWPPADYQPLPNELDLSTIAKGSITRYEMYLAEINAARNRGGDWRLLTSDDFDDSDYGAPHNHDDASNPQDLDPARRTLVAAAVDCQSEEFQGQSTITPIEYVRLFMTEPVREMGGNDKGAILVEVVESAGGLGSGSTSGIFRELVQLFR